MLKVLVLRYYSADSCSLSNVILEIVIVSKNPAHTVWKSSFVQSLIVFRFLKLQVILLKSGNETISPKGFCRTFCAGSFEILFLYCFINDTLIVQQDIAKIVSKVRT